MPMSFAIFVTNLTLCETLLTAKQLEILEHCGVLDLVYNFPIHDTHQQSSLREAILSLWVTIDCTCEVVPELGGTI